MPSVRNKLSTFWRFSPIGNDERAAGRYRVGTVQVIQGGTVNLAVLGGNLPPSFGRENFRTK